MPNMSRRDLFGMAGAAALSGAAWGQEPNGQRNWPTTPAREAIRKRYFPDLILHTHEGKPVRLYEDLIRDKIITLNFMYVNCADGTCPVTTHNLVKVQKLLRRRVGRDLFMYSITLDPESDTPTELRKYARSHGVGPGWLFLRAEPRDTEMLRRRLGFFDRNPALDAEKSNHVATVRYGNEPRQLWAATSAMAAPQVVARAILWVDGPGGDGPGRATA
jgi:protein SCO1/2